MKGVLGIFQFHFKLVSIEYDHNETKTGPYIHARATGSVRSRQLKISKTQTVMEFALRLRQEKNIDVSA